MLLYPATGYALDESFLVQGNIISIATVDLSPEWSAIHDRLLSLIR